MFLQAAGNLVDKPAGRRSYRAYLEWLSEAEDEKRKMGFENMLKGWAKGTEGFRRSIIENFKVENAGKVVESEAADLKASKYEAVLPELLKLLGKREEDLLNDRKGESWKVAVARYLRDRFLASNQWIAERLNMGKGSSVQSLVSRHRKRADGEEFNWEIIKNHEISD